MAVGAIILLIVLYRSTRWMFDEEAATIVTIIAACTGVVVPIALLASRQAPDKAAVSQQTDPVLPSSGKVKSNSISEIVFGCLVVAGVIIRVMLPPPPVVPDPDSAPILAESPQVLSERARATALYWQIAVEKLHLIRFRVPSGDMSAEKAIADRLDRLKAMTAQARNVSQAQVDQGLLLLVNRQLSLDDRVIQFHADVNEAKKHLPMPSSDAMSLDDTVAEWQRLTAVLQADSTLLDRLPEGPLRTLTVTALELEQQMLEQLHQMEIMQAVLQERYPGTRFPLPEISQ